MLAAAMTLSMASAVPVSAAGNSVAASVSINSLSSTSFKKKKVSVKKKYTATTKSVTISWKKLSGATGYRVYRYDYSAKKWRKVKTSKKTSYKDTTLKPGTNYLYCVKGYKKRKGKTYWSKKSAKKYVATKPNRSTVSVSNITDTTASLSWKRLNCDGYVLMRKNSNGKYTKVKTIKGKNNTSINLSGLKQNTNYSYGIKAYKRDKAKTNNYGKLATTKFTTAKKKPKPQKSWVDELSNLERAYYNVGMNSFNDSDWKLVYDDLCERALSFDEKKTVYISQGYYCEGNYVTFPEELHITIDTELTCSHDIADNGAPTYYHGGFICGATAKPRDFTCREDVLWWMEACGSNIDRTIQEATGYGYYDDPDMISYDVSVNPGWYFDDHMKSLEQIVYITLYG